MNAVDQTQSVVGKILTELRDIKERHEKLEEQGPDVNPYQQLDKVAVVQETRVFHDAGFVKLHPKRCCHHISKLLYFLIHGDTLSAADSSSVRNCCCPLVRGASSV